MSGFFPFDPNSSGGGGGGGITSMQIVETGVAYLVLVTDDIILAKGTFTVSLPPFLSANKSMTIKSVAGGGTITVDPDGSEVIEGQATHTLTVGTSITISPTVTDDWVII